MSRFRLYPTPEQDTAMRTHCAHARYIWNLALEQLNYRTRGQRSPQRAELDRQLSEARAAFDWLGQGSVRVQQQALRDFHRATADWWSGKRRRPTWRKQAQHEGFRIVGPEACRLEQLNSRWSRVLIPKVGWVKLRRSRDIPDAKSYRVTLDSSGRWHIGFAVRPASIPSPGDDSVIGVDRGVAVTLAYSDGTMLYAPAPAPIKAAARALSRCTPGSSRRQKARRRLARLHARNADRRRDFIEKTTTDLARRADLIRIEDLRLTNMTRSARGTVEAPGRHVAAKAGLNRSILASGWGAFAQRLEDKAPGRVEKINPAYTSLTCSACGTTDRKARESQAVFRCRSCGYADNADVNAARNIAAGRAVRGAEKSSASKREPQPAVTSTG